MPRILRSWSRGLHVVHPSPRSRGGGLPSSWSWRSATPTTTRSGAGSRRATSSPHGGPRSGSWPPRSVLWRTGSSSPRAATRSHARRADWDSSARASTSSSSRASRPGRRRTPTAENAAHLQRGRVSASLRSRKMTRIAPLSSASWAGHHAPSSESSSVVPSGIPQSPSSTRSTTATSRSRRRSGSRAPAWWPLCHASKRPAASSTGHAPPPRIHGWLRASGTRMQTNAGYAPSSTSVWAARTRGREPSSVSMHTWRSRSPGRATSWASGSSPRSTRRGRLFVARRNG
jgi:hypothetical protein